MTDAGLQVDDVAAGRGHLDNIATLQAESDLAHAVDRINEACDSVDTLAQCTVDWHGAILLAPTPEAATRVRASLAGARYKEALELCAKAA